MGATPVQLQATRFLGIRYARGVEHLLVDPRIKPTIDETERYMMGQATDEELKRAQV